MFWQVASLLLIFQNSCSAFIVNLNVTRTFDISTPVVTSICEITFQHEGPEKLDVYEFAIDPNIESFYVEFFDANRQTLTYTKLHDLGSNTYTFKINLLGKDEAPSKLYAHVYYLDVLVPYPKQKPFMTPQSFKCVANPHFYSPYLTKNSQTLYMKTRNVNENYDSKVFRFENDPAFTYNAVDVIFTSNDLLLQVTKLERQIDISHFGFIVITDNVVIRRIGSSILGSYQPIPKNVHDDQKFLMKTKLPLLADNILLFDDIGYIYSGNVEYSDTNLIFQYRYRYPLFANWKTTYSLQYTVPSYEFLNFNQNGLYRLEIFAIDNIVSDVSIDNVIVKILLPEGSRIKNVLNIPESLNRERDQLTQTALTNFGRPTILLSGKNAIEKHAIPVTVFYEFSIIYMLRTPLLICAYIYAVFLVIIVYLRIDFSLK